MDSTGTPIAKAVQQPLSGEQAPPKPLDVVEEPTQSTSESSSTSKKKKSSNAQTTPMRALLPRRVCRTKSKKLSKEDITLQDFIEERILKPGQELIYQEETTTSSSTTTTGEEKEQEGKSYKAWLTKDGWVSDEEDETHPTIEHWVAVIAKRKGDTREANEIINEGKAKRDLWKSVKVKTRTLAELRDAYIAWLSTPEASTTSSVIKKKKVSIKNQLNEELNQPFDTEDAKFPELEVLTVDESEDQTYIPPSHTPPTVETPTLSSRVPSTVSEPSAKMTEKDGPEEEKQTEKQEEEETDEEEEMMDEKKKKKRKKSSVGNRKKRKSIDEQEKNDVDEDDDEPKEKTRKKSEAEEENDGWMSKMKQQQKKKKGKKKSSLKPNEKDEDEINKLPTAIVIHDEKDDKQQHQPDNDGKDKEKEEKHQQQQQLQHEMEEVTQIGTQVPTIDAEWVSKKPNSPQTSQNNQPISTTKTTATPTPPKKQIEIPTSLSSNDSFLPFPPKTTTTTQEKQKQSPIDHRMQLSSNDSPMPSPTKPIQQKEKEQTKKPPEIHTSLSSSEPLIPAPQNQNQPPIVSSTTQVQHQQQHQQPREFGERSLSSETFGEIAELKRQIETNTTTQQTKQKPTSPPKPIQPPAVSTTTTPQKSPPNQNTTAIIRKDPIDKTATSSTTNVPIILPSNLKSELMVHLSMAVTKMGGSVLLQQQQQQQQASNSTHIVLETDEFFKANVRTTKLLQGIALGKWVLSYKWVLDSFAVGKWLDETPYEITGDPHSLANCCSAHIGRMRVKSGDLPLFHGHKFFISPTITPGIAQGIAEVILSAGGEILKYTPSAPNKIDEMISSNKHQITTHILAPPSTTVEQSKILYLQCGRRPISQEWPLDCISNYRLLPIKTYELAIAFGEELAGLATQHSLAY